jgi:glucose uptake protein GlcU
MENIPLIEEDDESMLRFDEKGGNRLRFMQSTKGIIIIILHIILFLKKRKKKKRKRILKLYL